MCSVSKQLARGLQAHRFADNCLANCLYKDGVVQVVTFTYLIYWWVSCITHFKRNNHADIHTHCHIQYVFTYLTAWRCLQNDLLCVECNVNPLPGTLKPQSNGPLVHYTAIRWLVHWPAKRGLVGLRPRSVPYRCTKCSSAPINGQCTNFILFDVAL